MKYSIEFEQHGQVKQIEDDKSAAYVDALLLYEGTFTDAHGHVITVTPNIINAIDKFYVNFLNSDSAPKKAIRKLFGKEPKINYKNVVLNHEKSDAMQIVGKVVGLDVRKSDGLTYLFGNLKILGRENVEKVEDGRWTEMSISFDYDEENGEAELREVSYVFEGAVNNAVSFSRNRSLTNNKISVELQKCRNDLSALWNRKSVLENQIKSVELKKKTSFQFTQLVKDGLISRSDQKRLMIDLELLDSSPHEVIVRAISTAARSRKALRGRFNSNFSANAFESFVDHVITPTARGEKMEGKTTIDPEKMGSAIAAALNAGKTSADFAASEKEKVEKGTEKVEKHEEDKHTARFKKEDMSRLCGMAKKSGNEELMNFLKEMGAEDSTDCAAEEEDPKKEASEKETEDECKEKKTHDHAALDARMTDLQAQLTQTNTELAKSNEIFMKLTEKFVDFSKGATPESEKEINQSGEK